MKRLNYLWYSVFAFSISLMNCLPSGPTSPQTIIPPVSLGKTVQVSLANSSANFEIGKCYAGRTSSSSSYAYWMMQVVNTSSTSLPFVRISGIRYKDAYGYLLSTDTSMDFTYVSGTVMAVGSSSIFTNTCLAPGDTGYFLGIDTVYNGLASISVDSISHSGSSVSAASAIISATNYSYQAPALDISVRNYGTVGAHLSQSYTLLLDASGVPLIWTFVSPVDSLIGAGAAGTYEDSYLSYSGSFHGVKLFPDFEDRPLLAKDLSKCRFSPAAAMTDEALRLLINERNRREAGKNVEKK